MSDEDQGEDGFTDREREALAKHPTFDNGEEFHPVSSQCHVVHPEMAKFEADRKILIRVRSIGRGGWLASCQCGWDSNYLSDETAAWGRAIGHSGASGHLLAEHPPNVIEAARALWSEGRR